jgi:hypothetical protein
MQQHHDYAFGGAIPPRSAENVRESEIPLLLATNLPTDVKKLCKIMSCLSRSCRAAVPGHRQSGKPWPLREVMPLVMDLVDHCRQRRVAVLYILSVIDNYSKFCFTPFL